MADFTIATVSTDTRKVYRMDGIGSVEYMDLRVIVEVDSFIVGIKRFDALVNTLTKEVKGGSGGNAVVQARDISISSDYAGRKEAQIIFLTTFEYDGLGIPDFGIPIKRVADLISSGLNNLPAVTKRIGPHQGCTGDGSIMQAGDHVWCTADCGLPI